MVDANRRIWTGVEEGKKMYAYSIQDRIVYVTSIEIINKSGSWFSYNDTKLGQGRDAVKQMISDNPELCEELETKIKEISS